MKLSKFIQNNNIHTSKFIIKGYCYGIDIIDNVKNIELLVLMYNLTAKTNKRQILRIKFDNTMQNVFYELICDNQYKLPKTTIKITNFKRILGYLQTEFQINTNYDGTTLYSNFLIINEDNNKKINIDIVDKDRFYNVSFKEFFHNLDSNTWVPGEMIVHNGKMHADDILSVALVKYVNPDIKIIRTRDVPENFDGIVADVGRGRYDHHDLNKPRIDAQTGEQYYNINGEPEYYASFGLLAKDILPGIVDFKGYYSIDHQYIRALDDSDNNGTFNDLASFFGLFNPTWNSNELEDEAFEKAVNVGLQFITRLINTEKAKMEAVPYVISKIKEMTDNILILDKRAPWQGLAKKSSAMLCIYPVDNGFALQCVKDINSNSRDNNLKITLPQDWIDNGIEGLQFCHKGLFFAIFDTQENAINAAKNILK